MSVIMNDPGDEWDAEKHDAAVVEEWYRLHDEQAAEMQAKKDDDTVDAAIQPE